MASKTTFEPFSSFSPSSSHRPRNYDIFLSFRGEDTRKNFTDHLYHALIDGGINTYRDDNELRRGKEIAIELLNAIQESRISLIVFSRNYAASRWCLDELVKIMECQSTARQMVLPIFYDVNPSDVRKQTGSFGEAFAKLEERFIADMERVSRWRDALTKAADLSGWDLTSAEHGYEATVIKKIVEEILNHLNNTYLNVAKYPVGIGFRVQYMNKLLRVGLNDVRIIGICSIGGMGKTTIAKAVFNQLFGSFQDKSFLANVREISKQPNGQVHLQKQLLFDILKLRKIKVNNVDRGINVIKERLCNKRVLLVLDDVDQLGQLNAIAGKRDWFGLGSRIIITTRDEHLLKEIEVDDTYMLDGLNFCESLELFSWHAFKKRHPKEDYIELSKDVISYCNGLPLALEVLGSFLFGRSIAEWKSALKKFQRTPYDQIQKNLRISYEALEDNNEKAIFLDIACFFIGVDQDYLVKILDGCGFFAEIGISILVQRCLIKIDGYNKVRMHDLLRDMGREIVREESPDESENRSRLWFYDDVLDILMKQTGTKVVQGLVLKLPTLNKVHLSTKALAKMPKLRLLQLNYVHGVEGNDNLFKELRWLCWHGFPWKVIPSSFHVENLVAMDMRYSKLRQVWKEIKLLERLKFLNLSHSHSLMKTPDFLQLPNLEKLILKDCTSLVDIHPSIGHLGRLVLVNMRDCKHVKYLPRSICRLKSLEILNLSGCSKIETLPEDLGEMEALIELLAGGTAIRRVPSSIVRLKNLRNLSLCGCKGSPSSSLASVFRSWVSLRLSLESIKLLPASLLGLSSLTRLSLQDCNLSDEAIPRDLGSLSSLQTLDLQSNNFCSLPISIRNLSKLQFLMLDHCTRLQSLPELPTSLESLYARGCISMERLPNLSKFRRTPHLVLTKCFKLVDTLGLGKSQTFGCIQMEACNSLSNTFKESLLQPSVISQMRGTDYLVFPGKEIPQWFSHQWTGTSSSFQQPDFKGCKIKGIALCAIYRSNTNIDEAGSSAYQKEAGNSNFLIDVERNKMMCIWFSPLPVFFCPMHVPISRQDHIWASHMCLDNHSLFYDGNEVEIKVIVEGELNVKKFGVRLIYDEAERSTLPYSGEMILSNLASYLAPYQNAIVVGDDGKNIFEDQAGSKAKRGRNDDYGAGPSHDGSEEEQHSKRQRYQAG